MKKHWISLVCTALLLAACGKQTAPPEPAQESLRQTHSGAVVGFADRFDTWTWLGIPYAAAPVGDLRWRAPQPATPWQGTREAISWGEMCPQFPIPMVSDTDKDFLGDEDCLFLNVSAPQSWQPGDKPLPVMVWIHGGGNALGSADLYSSVRNIAARENVIVVSIQYRLGLLGWFSHPALRETAGNPLDASGNFGTLDTIASLQWVQDNIPAFGGDTDNVTIFGESAGGINVFALLLSPLADGLFHRAISQSGILMNSTIASAEQLDGDGINPNSSTAILVRGLIADGKAKNEAAAVALLDSWSAEQTLGYLRSKSPEELLRLTDSQFMGMYFIAQLLRDGTVLPDEEPLASFTAGRFHRVPMIIGTNRDEIKTMMMRDPVYTQPLFGLIPRTKNAPLYNRVTGYGSDMWKVVGADEPAAAILASGHKDLYVYRFDWDDVSSNFLLDFKTLLGAGHGLEIPFVFHDTDGEMGFLPFAVIDDNNRETAGPLSASMSGYWGEFARNGKPGRGTGNASDWTRWTSSGNFLVLDVPAEGGIRMDQGRISRDDVFNRLAGDHASLGGPDGVCQAYQSLFGVEAMFGFAAVCPEGETCSSSSANFCPADDGN